MQLTEHTSQHTAERGVAPSLVESPAFSGGFPLQFGQPASLTAQGCEWYRSLEGHYYMPPAPPQSKNDKYELDTKHRPAIHACLTYGLEQGDIQPSELAALFNEKVPNDSAALALSSKVMAGVGQRLQTYRSELVEQMMTANVSELDKERLTSLFEWQEQYWLPTLTLIHVEDDYGEFGENADTLALRIHRDCYVCYTNIEIWDAPDYLRSLLILAVDAFATLAVKPVALHELDHAYMYEWGEACDPVYQLLCDEIPYLLMESESEDAAGKALITMLEEQAGALLEEVKETFWEGEDEFPMLLWRDMKSRHREAVYHKITKDLDHHSQLTRVRETLLQWDELQNPMLGHPVSQRLMCLTELYAQQPFAGKDTDKPINNEFDGDAPFNYTAMICTGDEREQTFIHLEAESTCNGEYGVEVMGLNFEPDLEPYLKQMLFGDMALMYLQGANE